MRTPTNIDKPRTHHSCVCLLVADHPVVEAHVRVYAVLHEEMVTIDGTLPPSVMSSDAETGRNRRGVPALSGDTNATGLRGSRLGQSCASAAAALPQRFRNRRGSAPTCMMSAQHPAQGTPNRSRRPSFLSLAGYKASSLAQATTVSNESTAASADVDLEVSGPPVAKS